MLTEQDKKFINKKVNFAGLKEIDFGRAAIVLYAMRYGPEAVPDSYQGVVKDFAANIETVRDLANRKFAGTEPGEVAGYVSALIDDEHARLNSQPGHRSEFFLGVDSYFKQFEGSEQAGIELDPTYTVMRIQSEPRTSINMYYKQEHGAACPAAKDAQRIAQAVFDKCGSEDVINGKNFAESNLVPSGKHKGFDVHCLYLSPSFPVDTYMALVDNMPGIKPDIKAAMKFDIYQNYQTDFGGVNLSADPVIEAYSFMADKKDLPSALSSLHRTRKNPSKEYFDCAELLISLALRGQDPDTAALAHSMVADSYMAQGNKDKAVEHYVASNHHAQHPPKPVDSYNVLRGQSDGVRFRTNDLKLTKRLKIQLHNYGELQMIHSEIGGENYDIAVEKIAELTRRLAGVEALNPSEYPAPKEEEPLSPEALSTVSSIVAIAQAKPTPLPKAGAVQTIEAYKRTLSKNLPNYSYSRPFNDRLVRLFKDVDYDEYIAGGELLENTLVSHAGLEPKQAKRAQWGVEQSSIDTSNYYFNVKLALSPEEKKKFIEFYEGKIQSVDGVNPKYAMHSRKLGTVFSFDLDSMRNEILPELAEHFKENPGLKLAQYVEMEEPVKETFIEDLPPHTPNVGAAAPTPIEDTLHDSVDKNRPDDITRLIKAQADPNGRDERGRTPLWTAAQYGYTDCVKALITGNADVDITVKYTPLGAEEETTPIQRAKQFGSRKAVVALLDAGANADSAVEKYAREKCGWQGRVS